MFEDLRERDIGHKGEVAEPPPPPPPPPAMAGGQMSRDDDLEAPLMEEEADALRHPPVLENAPPSRERDTLLYVCAVLSIVTAVGALLCMVVNLISLLRSFDYRGFDYRVSVCADFTLFLFLFLLQISFSSFLHETNKRIMHILLEERYDTPKGLKLALSSLYGYLLSQVGNLCCMFLCWKNDHLQDYTSLYYPHSMAT